MAILSKPIIDEVLTVMYVNFSRNREAVSHNAVYLSELGQNVETKKQVSSKISLTTVSLKVQSVERLTSIIRMQE